MPYITLQDLQERFSEHEILDLADDGAGEIDPAVVGRPHGMSQRHVERTRQIVAHGVEQWLHADVAKRRTAQDGRQPLGQGGTANGLIDCLQGRFFARKIHLHEDVVFLGQGFKGPFPGTFDHF